MGRNEPSAGPHEAQPVRNPGDRTLARVSPDVTVGVIANPASGRDIRRLVAGASVFGNADKAGMVFRLLAGLGAAGVGRVLMMPAADGLSTTLRRHLHGRHTAPGFDGAAPFPVLEEVALALDGTARDSVVAVERMLEAGVAAIVVLGGDGTHRVVAKACGDVPLCALSTGTNNAFPEMREATVAGLATGLVATGRASDGALRREAALEVRTPGGEPDIALVDVAVTRERFVGARALWRPDDVSEVFVTFASPSAVGLSAVAGALQPLERGAGQGLHVRLARDGAAVRRTVKVALAPGLIVDVAVAEHRVLALGEEVEVVAGAGTVALDGEREIERRHGEPVTVRLAPGPLTIDVDAVMRAAAGDATPTQPGRA
jgi:predicted polyphosphate/ATP-dependent NAD kinase